MELQEARGRIDAIDKDMLRLFLERMRLAEEIGAYKAKNDLPVLNKAREREVLAGVQREAGAYEPYAYNLFSTLMSLSRARQNELFSHDSAGITKTVQKALAAGEDIFPKTGTVACQGVEGSNSQAACDKLLPRGNIVYVNSFEAVFDAVESGLCRFGVLPVENSTNGSVRAVYELLQSKRFSIVRATNLYIHHELMARPGTNLADIREVYSHEQALGQCSRFLAGLGGGVKIIPCGNTAMAAKLVADSGRSDCAAICSHGCAELYGLRVVCQDVQDSDNNYTRFICIARDPAAYAGADKISLTLSCSNKPGALYDILSKLAARGINMSKLESCPVKGRSFEFVFFIELEASLREPGVPELLCDLADSCESFGFLGSYAVV